jgi:acyl-CoA synthetase (NDP forming)
LREIYDKLRRERNVSIEKMTEKSKLKTKRSLSEHEAKLLLKNYGIPVVEEIVVQNADEALAAAAQIGFPVVLKGLGAALLHKTELGIVHLNLTDERSVREAAEYVKIRAGKDLEGFLIQPQIKGKREFVAGLFRDPQFGPVVMFGAGGIFTEAISDVAFRLAPLSENDALEMLEEIHTKALLGNFRGEKAVDKNQLIQILKSMSRIGVERPDIAEIDINPLIITPEGKLCAVDALAVMKEISPSSDNETKPKAAKIDPAFIRNFFHPKSVAFVGASSQLGKWGHTLPVVTISKGYEGEIYLVNPKGGTIVGRESYKSVTDIPGNVDLAIVTVPASLVADLIPQLKEKGIHNMLLISSGFSETGAEGRKLEEALVKKAREAGILLLGPNTMGICNPHIRFYCTGGPVWPRAGATSVVAQSGNMGAQLLAFAERQDIGIRAFAGSGNEAMITVEDYVEALGTDDLTRTVMLYIESVKDGRRFFEAAARVGKKKPIVLLKGGRTKAGQRAAASHTGALASDSKVFDAVCKQAGIVKVEYPMDLLDLSAAFSSLPLPKGNRAAIITLGGGWGVVTADLCSEHGLSVPDLSPELIEYIDKMLPPYWSHSNPVDIVGENEESIAMDITEALLKWEGCDAVINLGIMGRKILLGRVCDASCKSDPSCSPTFTETMIHQFSDFEKNYVKYVVTLMEKYDKPVFGVSILTEDKEQTVYRVKDSRFKGIFYPTPERAVKAFARMYEYWRFVSR